MRLFCLAVMVSGLLPAMVLQAAESPLTASEFEAATTGKTMNYAAGVVVFGTEFYQPGRKVLWAFTSEECHEGTWYPQDDAICFAYDDLDGPQCWLFFQTEAGLTAQFIGPDGVGEPASVSESAAPLSCMGPEVGV